MDKEKVREAILDIEKYFGIDGNIQHLYGIKILFELAEAYLDGKLVEPMGAEEIKKIIENPPNINRISSEIVQPIKTPLWVCYNVQELAQALVGKVGKQKFKINPDSIFEFEPTKSCCGNKGTYLEGKKVICCDCKKVIKEI